jgi:aromatic-L-amino-acid decarboxylase
MARELVSWIESDPDWELLAPVPFATVCLRCRPAGNSDEEALDRDNQKLLEAFNRAGPVFLSHTRLAGRYTIRVSIGNPRARMDHVRACWDQLQAAAREVGLLDGGRRGR